MYKYKSTIIIFRYSEGLKSPIIMSCEEYNYNMSLSLMARTRNITLDFPQQLSFSLNKVGLPIICIFGLFGNMLNLLILTRKQLQRSMDQLEKSAHMSLVALAVSDLFFCIVALPLGFIKSVYLLTEDKSFVSFYYQGYHEPFLNMFIFSSTWLTVVMATGRYLAICHPLHARWFVDFKSTRIAILTVFFFSVAFNMPRFFSFRIVEANCTMLCKCYYKEASDLFKNSTFLDVYMFIWAIIGVFIPLVLMACCNICLIRALQKSNRMRRLYRVNQPGVDSSHRLTATLIAIVVFFLILVTPSEIRKFVYFIYKTHRTPDQYSDLFMHIIITGATVTNFLQAVNFTVNFILYCIINVHFRNTIKQIISCEKNRLIPQNITLNMSEFDTDL